MKKNILVIDDSALMRRVICDIINADTNFQVTDICKDGLEGYEQLKKKSYDAVIMDVNMPRMNGLELLSKLQEEKIKATVIVVSSLTTKDAETTILAMERGAVDFVTKPGNIIEAKGDTFKNNLMEVLRAVLRVEVSAKRTPASQMIRKPHQQVAAKGNGKKLVALACSTGGPKALQSVIPYLPANLNAPVVLVQHMPVGFTKSMADRLNEVSKVHVKEAEEGDVLRAGWVYVAPGGKHLEVKRLSDGTHKVTLTDRPPVGGLRPYANYMYESLTGSTYDEIICVVLTGMGADGTMGIKKLDQVRNVHVICQNEESCVVFGMPKAAIDAGLADEVVTLTDVAQSIMKSVGVK
ncbi:MAG: chemotaxis-specific protein-glutamate methyltransferase CheB [Lachnospiraceae bacterium]|jgi:two-component system chemotaxis response regulator CheB|nr:chemotaxis-specific protein-glutamate methyltransferase CheB [Lachnospiraceae bacterium]